MSDFNVSLLPWQQEVWNHPAKNHVIVAGRRCGKSEFVVLQMLFRALTDGLDGSRFYVAPTAGQARDAVWSKFLKLGQGVISKSHINNLEITLVNGQSIVLKGADRPETMRGVKLADVAIDEYADMKPYVLEEILMPAMTDLDAPLTIIGSPMGRNHFYDLYQSIELGEEDEEWASWHFTSYDNPMLNLNSIAKRKKKMSSHAFRQEFMASFEAQGSEIFDESWIKFDTEEPKGGEFFIACDLAGFEDVGNRKKRGSRLDDSAFVVVKSNNDGWWVAEIVSGRWDLNTTAQKLFQLVEKYKPASVGIEKGIAKQAVMSPLLDMMQRYNRFFRIEDLSHGNKKKQDRIIWALQARFENGYISLNKGDWNNKFMDQLFQFPDRLTHDDLIDALAYIDQLVKTSYHTDVLYDDWEPIDEMTGY